MIKTLFQALDDLHPEMVDLRRDLHMHPELSNQEKRTPQLIADYLTQLGLDVKTNVGGNGVVGYLTGDHPGKTVALRADFDALPMQDEKNVPYKSRIDGVTHACGHDVHTAALLGVAKVLSKVKHQLAGTVVFIHQFAEEVAPGGAERMIADGCLEGVDAIYGAHVWSENEVGEILFNEGYTMAAADTFEIDILGKGGHGALPHLAIDPVVAASQLVVSIQQIASRSVDPLKSVVITVGSFHSGEALNVIPDSASIKGTVRTYDEDVRSIVEKKLRDLVKRLECQTGAKAKVDYQYGHTSLYNHPAQTKELKQLTETHLAEFDIKRKEPFMGAEDFAYYLQDAPGTFFFVGGKNKEVNADYPHHHPKFDVDENTLGTIGKVMLLSLFNHNLFIEKTKEKEDIAH
ncbi:M20 metallopeptidase family protein [Halobacillus amylolyticus]|uniref:Amidohydrolase n=1 Tax=Halobacillus amylolyticus TaxID=2932259 RepID=A0ABY4H9C6_9BACI|nr:amidohydrolase [Halobacillus amylolyticus]UOR11407.1 amidohydrolase [Halobacillus amylolyticus]